MRSPRRKHTGHDACFVSWSPQLSVRRPLSDQVNQEVVRGALAGLCDIYCAMDGNQAASIPHRLSPVLHCSCVVLFSFHVEGPLLDIFPTSQIRQLCRNLFPGRAAEAATTYSERHQRLLSVAPVSEQTPRTCLRIHRPFSTCDTLWVIVARPPPTSNKSGDHFADLG